MTKGIYYRWTDGIGLLQHADTLPIPEPVKKWIRTYQRVDTFCVRELLTLMKCFSTTKDDANPDNYYMEREWRTASPVQFSLKDVWRAILP
jgi:hypothetical protein